MGCTPKKLELNRLIPVFGKKIGLDPAQLESDFGPLIFHSNFGKRIWVETDLFRFSFFSLFFCCSSRLKPNFGRKKKIEPALSEVVKKNDINFFKETT
jgi:hypothetical protein